MIQNSSNLKGKQVVSGHNIKDLDTIRKSIESLHIFLDNGAFTQAQPEKGNLVALNLDAIAKSKCFDNMLILFEK